MNWAERLKAAREFCGYSQEDMASRLDVPYRTYQGYENGASTPKVKVLENLAALGFAPMWVLTNSGPMRAEDAVAASPSVAQPAPARSEPDEELMRAIGNGIDTVYREFGARLGPGDIARLAERVRVDVVNSGARTTDEKQVAMRVSLDQLRRELRHPVADAGKGSACS